MMHPGPGAGPGGLRERKKQLRRDALHQAALGLIERQGLDATTVEQICEEVGVSPRTFFNYFPSKTAAALKLPETVITAEAAARFRGARGELMPAVCELLESSMRAGLERDRLKRALADQPELMAAFGQWVGTLKEEFGRLVEERAGSPEVAAAATALALSALKALVDSQQPDDRPDAVRLLETVDRMIAVRHAPLADPPPAPAAD
jgi:AcrR family transcriptional regulator